MVGYTLSDRKTSNGAHLVFEHLSRMALTPAKSIDLIAKFSAA